MKWDKKRICMVIAGVVSVCCLVSVIATVQVAVAAVKRGGAIPSGMVMLSLVTLLCAVMIWKGVREMD